MNIVFVCKEHSFASIAAQRSLNHYANQNSITNLTVSSAGIKNLKQELEPITHITLSNLGLPEQKHIPSELSRFEAERHVVIAMDEHARNHIQKEYSRLVPLFNEVCYNRTESIEAIKEHDLNEHHNHIITSINHIHHSMPVFLENLPKFT